MYSRKEVEELSLKKKGWQKSYHNNNGSSLLNNEDLFNNDENNNNNILSGNISKIPKSMLEFGRDFRRFNNDNNYDTKISYLLLIGTSKFKKIMNNADDFELLENIVMTIINYNDDNNNNNNTFKKTKWLKAVSTIKQYSMLLDCLSVDIKLKLNCILSDKIIKHDEINNNEMIEALD